MAKVQLIQADEIGNTLRSRGFSPVQQPRLIKSKPHRQVYILNDHSGASGVVIKQFRPQKLRHKIRAAFNPFPTAAREFLVSKLLLKHEIPTAEPIAWKTSHLRVNSYFIAKLLPSCETLEQFLGREMLPERRAQALVEYARILARLHLKGVYVDDFGLHNVLIDFTAEIAQLWLIDHEATRFFAGYFNRWRLKNLYSALAGTDGAQCLSESEEELVITEYRRALAASIEQRRGAGRRG